RSQSELNDKASDYAEEARAIVKASVDEGVESIDAVGCPGATHDHCHGPATGRESHEKTVGGRDGLGGHRCLTLRLTERRVTPRAGQGRERADEQESRGRPSGRSHAHRGRTLVSDV